MRMTWAEFVTIVNGHLAAVNADPARTAIDFIDVSFFVGGAEDGIADPASKPLSVRVEPAEPGRFLLWVVE